jgi:hypothetical protein
VPLSAVAQHLGVSLADFEACRPELERRGFPKRYPTSAQHCIEAVGRWRLRRFPRLFPELAAVPMTVDTRAVVED